MSQLSQLWFVYATRHWVTICTCLVEILHAFTIFVTFIIEHPKSRTAFLSHFSSIVVFLDLLKQGILCRRFLFHFCFLLSPLPGQLPGSWPPLCTLSVGDFIHCYSVDYWFLYRSFPSTYSHSFSAFSKLKIISTYC